MCEQSKSVNGQRAGERGCARDPAHELRVAKDKDGSHGEDLVDILEDGLKHFLLARELLGNRRASVHRRA